MAAQEVFSVPELLELILLSLPCDNTHQEIAATRTILQAQSTCQLWQELVQKSTPIRQKLYQPTSIDTQQALVWHEQHPFPPARPNPWIPDLLLNQRSWGTAYPFDTAYTFFGLQPSQPRYWTFSFEVSRAQFTRFPQSGPWRSMLATSPPFTDLWATRSFYELRSGRAPFVTHIDYDPKLPKHQQKHRIHRADGITLGDMCDAIGELFDKHPAARFIMIESVRVQASPSDTENDRPTTKTYIPGSSAEKAHGWHRTL